MSGAARQGTYRPKIVPVARPRGPLTSRPGRGQFERVTDAVPPFALARALPPCPALLGCAGRASLGGARETLLGAVMAVRLLSGMTGAYPLARPVRALRAEAARLWLGALTLPAKPRTAILRAFATSAADDPVTAADALMAVTDITAPHLDRGARSELVRLAESLRDRGVLAAPRPAPVP